MHHRTRAESARVYAKVYGDMGRFIRTKLKWRGIHSLIVSLLREELSGARVLDAGCGLGRFAFLASRRASRVDGFDRTPAVVDAADAIRESLGITNVRFSCADIDRFGAGNARYDVAYLGGTLEHLLDPLPSLRRLRHLLAPGGVLVVNSPSESNFRGDVSTTLGTLFGFPMTLTDVRRVTPRYMDGLCERVGFSITRVIGCSYGRAWGRLGAEDLALRIPNVLDDVRDQVVGLRPRLAAFTRWVRERAEENRPLLDYLVARNILRRIPLHAPFRLRERVLRAHGLPVAAIRAFLAPEFGDPYYTEQEPFNRMGGQTVYVLRRTRS